MTEQKFVESFDAKFPYDDEEAATALIHQGWAISPNAAFCVLEEICRLPRGAAVDTGAQHSLAAQWAASGQHPLMSAVLRCAAALIDSTPLSSRDAVGIMRDVSAYSGQYAALNIAYFSGDCSTPEGDGALEQASIEIRKQWETLESN